MIYILENTYNQKELRGRLNAQLVESYLGEPILIDAADMGAAAHRVRNFWTNMLPASILQSALPKCLSPIPSLADILHPYHFAKRARWTDQRPFSPQNKKGCAKVCMPDMGQVMSQGIFHHRANKSASEGEVYNAKTGTWEGPDVEENERLLGFRTDDTATTGVCAEIRSIRIAMAMEGNTMRWLGAFLYASQQ